MRSETYDQNVVEDHIKKIGCRTPFQKVDFEVPICSTGKNMQLAQYSISLENFDNHPYPRPCNSIENIKFNYDDNPRRDSYAGLIRFSPLKTTNYFKEIEQTKAIPFLDLIGNVGGFIGIFIGHSVLQLLQSMLGIRIRIKRLINKKISTNKNKRNR